jgi:hypothetical protein
MLQSFCAGLTCVEEKFYSHERRGFVLSKVTDKARWWDVYCRCWKK